jgi:seryl-tRNA synthetase
MEAFMPNRKKLNPDPQEKKLRQREEKIYEKDLIEQLEEEEQELMQQHEDLQKEKDHH